MVWGDHVWTVCVTTQMTSLDFQCGVLNGDVATCYLFITAEAALPKVPVWQHITLCTSCHPSSHPHFSLSLFLSLPKRCVPHLWRRVCVWYGLTAVMSFPGFWGLAPSEVMQTVHCQWLPAVSGLVLRQRALGSIRDGVAYYNPALSLPHPASLHHPLMIDS